MGIFPAKAAIMATMVHKISSVKRMSGVNTVKMDYGKIVKRIGGAEKVCIIRHRLPRQANFHKKYAINKNKAAAGYFE